MVNYFYRIENVTEQQLKEMIIQRLHQGFQLYNPPNSNQNNNTIYLSKENQLQVLSMDLSDGIEVKRFTTVNLKKILYSYQFLFEDKFVEKQIYFSNSKEFNWNHIDMMISKRKQADIIDNNANPSTIQFYMLPNPDNTDPQKSFQQFTESTFSRVLVLDQNSKFKVTFSSQDNSYFCKMELIHKETKEWAQFIYKSVYKINQAYVFQIKWISCSSLLIIDFINSLQRRGKMCGFQVIQAPMYDDPKSDCSLHHHPVFYFEKPEILEKAIIKLCQEPFNFLYEELGKTLIHVSGTCLLKIHKTNLIWIYNRQVNLNFNAKIVLEKVQNFNISFVTSYQIIHYIVDKL